MYSSVIKKILSLKHDEAQVLFKPVQLDVLKKLLEGSPLSENEKRYLRGHLGEKLRTIEILHELSDNDDQLVIFLKMIGDYYITGYSALQYNGFGWYFDPKRIEVVNTRVEGRMRIKNASVILRRVRSLGQPGWTIDPMTGLRYATNEKIIKDAIWTGQDDLLRTCNTMLERYGKMFVKRPKDFKDLKVV